MNTLTISSRLGVAEVRAKSKTHAIAQTRCGSRSFENVRMTKRLQEYLDAIQLLYNRVGRCTMRDIGAAVGVTSSSTINDAIQRLVAMGHMRRVMRGSISYYEPMETREGMSEDLLSELRRLDGYSTLPACLTKYRVLWEVA